ncbi:MAG: hypothetical protein KDA54_02785 [Phycisphaerales bacterium]|nr:hypothetical protein [Phycisphaerales bacterium]
MIAFQENPRVFALVAAFLCLFYPDAANVVLAERLEDNPRLLEKRVLVGQEEYVVRLSRARSECVFTSDEEPDTARSLVNLEMHLRKAGEAHEKLVWWNSTIDLSLGDSPKILGKPVFDVCGFEYEENQRLYLAIGNTYYDSKKIVEIDLASTVNPIPSRVRNEFPCKNRPDCFRSNSRSQVKIVEVPTHLNKLTIGTNSIAIEAVQGVIVLTSRHAESVPQRFRLDPRTERWEAFGAFNDPGVESTTTNGESE